MKGSQQIPDNILKDFPISTADGVRLGNEEKRDNTEVSQISLLSSGVNEVSVTEERLVKAQTFLLAKAIKKM